MRRTSPRSQSLLFCNSQVTFLTNEGEFLRRITATLELASEDHSQLCLELPRSLLQSVMKSSNCVCLPTFDHTRIRQDEW